MEKYIGPNKVKSQRVLDEKTPGGTDIYEVEYENGDKEVFSKFMYDAVLSDKSCDLSELRDKRVFPVVGSVLAILREWGIKINELTYFSTLLDQSLTNNEKEAVKALWKQWSPTVKSYDDADLVTVDRVLKALNGAIPSPYQKE